MLANTLLRAHALSSLAANASLTAAHFRVRGGGGWTLPNASCKVRVCAMCCQTWREIRVLKSVAAFCPAILKIDKDQIFDTGIAKRRNGRSTSASRINHPSTSSPLCLAACQSIHLELGSAYASWWFDGGLNSGVSLRHPYLETRYVPVHVETSHACQPSAGGPMFGLAVLED